MKVERCGFHKAKNLFPLVPEPHQAAFKTSWDAVSYAAGEGASGARVRQTTHPIERVNKELKRRAKAMETASPDGLKALGDEPHHLAEPTKPPVVQ